MNIELKPLEGSGFSKEEYLEFLNKCYGKSAKHKLDERLPWLSKASNYTILLAIMDNKIVGQACSYETTASAQGKEIQVTWGVDNFVLPETRGKGVGKMLQKHMHDNKVNFSSAWYSPTNGYIKRKCGSRAFTNYYFPYYAISKFFGIYLELAIFKIFKKKIRIPSRIPNLYCKIFNRRKSRNYEYKEISYFSPEHIAYIQDVLDNNYDFYVKRSSDYLNWKYFENPSIKDFHIMEIRKESKIVAIISFSAAQSKKYICTEYFGATILDAFIGNKELFSERDIIPTVVNYYKEKNISLDGICTIFDFPYFPKIKYPKQGSPFLSTYNGEIKKPYISLMDQDMERI